MTRARYALAFRVVGFAENIKEARNECQNNECKNEHKCMK